MDCLPRGVFAAPHVVVPREFIPAVEKGLVESMANGVLAGYPMVDVKAKLYDGSILLVEQTHHK